MEVLNIVGYDFQCTPKGGFFSESAICFSNLKKKIFQKTILDLKFKFHDNNTLLLLAEI
jgi:hypothetical protein